MIRKLPIQPLRSAPGRSVKAGAAGDNVIVTLREAPFNVPVTVVVTAPVTALAVAVNVVDDDPPATVTEAGTVSEELLSESATVTPPEGAAALSATTQVIEPAPLIDPVPHASEDSCGATGAPGSVTGVPVTGHA
jgi:hypothetical protein